MAPDLTPDDPQSAIDDSTDVEERSYPRSDPNEMTGSERRRRIIVLSLLLLLLLLLAYASYYFAMNRRLPGLSIAQPTAAIAPPQYLYSIAGKGPSELNRPVGVGVAPDGRVYVVDFGNRRVSVFTNAGGYLFSFNTTAEGKLVNAVHLQIRGNEVWVSDRYYHAIYIFDMQGKYLRKYTPKNEVLQWTPLAFSFDATGGLKVTDVGQTNKHRLLYFSADGSRTVTLGQTAQVNKLQESPGSFMFPDGVAVAADGNVYVSDGDNRRVQVFNPKGEFVRFMDTSGVPRGIAIDSKQRIYVADALAHMIGVYDLKGTALTTFGTRGYGPGQFNYPNDIAIDKGGRIYITDRENNQVQVWGWPVAALPAVTLPSTPAGWLGALACCIPLLFIPLLMLARRKIRIVVTPEFMDALENFGEIGAVAEKSRLRLIAPEQDRKHYEGRMADGVLLTELLTFEEYSESDARALRERLRIEERPSVLLVMADRAKALATVDRELRILALVAKVRAVDVQEFREIYLGRDRSKVDANSD